MKNKETETTCRVSDRAFRKFIMKCSDVYHMFEFSSSRVYAEVVEMVITYLTTGKVMTDVYTESRLFFQKIRPEMDKAIQRSAKAKAAAQRRKELKTNELKQEKQLRAPELSMTDRAPETVEPPTENTGGIYCKAKDRTSDTVLT